MFEVKNMKKRPLMYNLEGGKSFRLLARRTKEIEEEEITEKMRKDEKDGLIKIKQKDLPKAKFVEEESKD